MYLILQKFESKIDFFKNHLSVAFSSLLRQLMLFSPCSHVHCPLKMRFLECPPDLGEEGYVDEAERFYDDPFHWLRTSFPYKSALPTHLVLFDVLEKVSH